MSWKGRWDMVPGGYSAGMVEDRIWEVRGLMLMHSLVEAEAEVERGVVGGVGGVVMFEVTSDFDWDSQKFDVCLLYLSFQTQGVPCCVRKGRIQDHSRFMDSEIKDNIDISDLQMGVLEDRIIFIYELGRNGRGG